MLGLPSSNRDLALTTLVDLLVQVIFILVLIIVGSNILESEPEIPTVAVPLEPWKTLVSISEIDPRLPVAKQADALTENLQELKKQLAKAKEDLENCEARYKTCETERIRFGNLLGGASRPVCKDDNNREEFVLKVLIDQNGDIDARAIGAGTALALNVPVSSDAFSKSISATDFRKYFVSWRDHGVSRNCSYRVEINYSPSGDRRSYEQARYVINQYFRQSIPKTIGPQG